MGAPVKHDLRVREIFTTISGECGMIPQGTLCTLVRMQGCNLHCDYCDTPRSQPSADPDVPRMTSFDLAQRIRKQGILHSTPYVLITGGEPMLQQKELASMFRMMAHRYSGGSLGIMHFQVETNSTIPPSTDFVVNGRPHMVYNRKDRRRSPDDFVDLFLTPIILIPGSGYTIKYMIGSTDDVLAAMSDIQQIVRIVNGNNGRGSIPSHVFSVFLSVVNSGCVYDKALTEQCMNAIFALSSKLPERFIRDYTPRFGLNAQIHKTLGVN